MCLIRVYRTARHPGSNRSSPQSTGPKSNGKGTKAVRDNRGQTGGKITSPDTDGSHITVALAIRIRSPWQKDEKGRTASGETRRRDVKRHRRFIRPTLSQLHQVIRRQTRRIQPEGRSVLVRGTTTLPSSRWSKQRKKTTCTHCAPLAGGANFESTPEDSVRTGTKIIK